MKKIEFVKVKEGENIILDCLINMLRMYLHKDTEKFYFYYNNFKRILDEQ